MVEQCCKPPFFLHLCALPLKVTVFLWWHLTKWLCPLIMPSYALNFSAIQPQTNVHTLPHTFTHRVRGSSIHLGLDSCTLFHLMPNQEWSLDAAMEPNQERLRYVYMHTRTNIYINIYIYTLTQTGTDSNPIPKNAFGEAVAYTTPAQIVRLCICAMAWKSFSLFWPLCMCFFSEEVAWKAYWLWRWIERPSCSLYSLQQLWRHSVLTHAHIQTQTLQMTWSISPLPGTRHFKDIRANYIIIISSHTCLLVCLCVRVHMRSVWHTLICVWVCVCQVLMRLLR